jgi:hypothetical protein
MTSTSAKTTLTEREVLDLIHDGQTDFCNLTFVEELKLNDLPRTVSELDFSRSRFYGSFTIRDWQQPDAQLRLHEIRCDGNVLISDTCCRRIAAEKARVNGRTCLQAVHSDVHLDGLASDGLFITRSEGTILDVRNVISNYSSIARTGFDTVKDMGSAFGNQRLNLGELAKCERVWEALP